MGGPLDWKREAARTVAYLLRWSSFGLLTGVFSGLASALFLYCLARATEFRGMYPALVWGLPVAGLLTGWAYNKFGKESGMGNNLLLDRVHDPRGSIPFRMAPLVLFSSVLTHLFGGSAGREGTAVQMGGTLADMVVRPLHLGKEERRLLIMAGIAGGFGSVFGTPLAGAVFGLEVSTVGRIKLDGLVPCLVASIVGDVVCRGCGIHHDLRPFVLSPVLSLPFVGWLVLASMAFAIASTILTESVHALQSLGKKHQWTPYVKPVIGGLAVIVLTLSVGNQDYNGLGLPLIASALRGEAPDYGWALKLLFTVVTLGVGFKGGEVTPLFCIGSLLGSAFAHLTHNDPTLFAALGFVSVFAASANTPVACLLMGIELFGASFAVPLAIVCVLTYVLTGHRGIYASQRIHQPKAEVASWPHRPELRPKEPRTVD